MKTAVDSNVISALWTGEPSSTDCRLALAGAQEHSMLAICAPVYCELHACPGVTPELVHRFLTETGIVAEFHMDEAVWHEAALRFARYANRRRRSMGQSPKRMLVDFIVGAHALLRADALLTLDQNRYTRDFPELKLLSTATAS